MVLIKFLPLFDNMIAMPVVTFSDDNFLYVEAEDNIYLVYNPKLQTHNCLVYQFELKDDYFVHFSAASVSGNSLIVAANETFVSNYLLSANPTLEIYPGSYFGMYAISVKYNLTIYNNYSTVNVTKQG